MMERSKREMGKSLLLKVIGIVTGILLIALFFVGWTIGNDLTVFFSDELSRTIQERLDAVDTLYESFEHSLYDNSGVLMRSKDLGVLGATPEYNDAVKNVYSLSSADALSNLIYEQELQDMIASVVIYPAVSDYYVTDHGISPKTGNVKLPNNIQDILSKIEARYQREKTWQHSYLYLGEYENRNALVYLYPISGYYFYGKGFVIVTVWEDELCAMINGIGYDDVGTSIFMVGEDGTVLCAKDKKLLGSSYDHVIQELNQQQTNAEHFVYGMGELTQLVVTYDGTQRFVADYHMSDLCNKLLDFQRKSMTIFIVATLCAVFAAVLLLHRAYRPLQQLIHSVRQRVNFSGADTELLSSAFQSLMRSENDLRNRLQRNALTEREHDIICLLNNREQPTEHTDSVDKRNYYVALTVWIDNYAAHTSQFNNEERFYNKSLINKIFEQYQQDEVSFKGAILFSGTIGIICASDNVEREFLDKVLTEISDQVQKAVSYSVSIGVGQAVGNPADIWKSFNQSQDAVRYRFFQGRSKVIFYDAHMKEIGVYRYPSREEKRLINQLLSGNQEELQASMQAFFDAVKSMEPPSVDNALHCLNSLVINIWSVVSENEQFDCREIHVFVFLEHLLRQETMEDAEKLLLSFLQELSQKRHADEKPTQSGDIIAYINENYMHDIDINAVAAQFGLSYSYVRKLFKEKTGKTILDYLNSLRVRRVKELLEQTDHSIVQIAGEAGFYNEQALFRTFKKYEGITPGEYRKSCRNKGAEVVKEE